MSHEKSDTLPAAVQEPRRSPADSLLARLAQLRKSDPGNIKALSEIGSGLARLGRDEEARECYRMGVEALRRHARANDITGALNCEQLLYLHFVKAVEDESHYHRCFSDWTEELAALGRRFSDGAAPPQDCNRIAFFLQTGPLLGHTEVLLKLLASRPRSGADRVEPLVYVLEACSRVLLERCREIGIELVQVPEKMASGDKMLFEHKFAWVRERFRRDRIAACIWVSAPTLATFAYSARIAPVQIFWALRFHALSGSFIDGYITSFGARGESERVYFGQKWRVCLAPLTIDIQAPDPGQIAAVRARYSEPFLFGTIAREEKINNQPYLECVARLLRKLPHAGFVWTGRAEHAGVSAFFRSAGVGERCHFAGWVDVNLYARAFDVFLETFPLGAGVSGYCALAGRVPLVSYLAPYTVYGSHLWQLPDAGRQEPRDRLISRSITEGMLCLRSPEEYVALAAHLATDDVFRKTVGDAGRAFFEREKLRAGEDARRFFDTVRAIAREKLSVATLV